MKIDKKEFMSTLIYIVCLVGIMVLLRTFVFSSVIVKGSSMDPTLEDGERLFALKMAEINQFDIVTFPAPDAKDKTYIKRVIGMPGDSLYYDNDQLYINDKKIEEPYLDEYKGDLTDDLPLTYNFTLEEATGKSKVPEGKYFVMGDNRRNSKDSRMIGFIDAKDIIGDVKFAFWPLDRFGPITSYSE